MYSNHQIPPGVTRADVRVDLLGTIARAGQAISIQYWMDDDSRRARVARAIFAATPRGAWPDIAETLADAYPGDSDVTREYAAACRLRADILA